MSTERPGMTRSRDPFAACRARSLRIQINFATDSDSMAPVFPIRFRHPISMWRPARHLRSVAHGGEWASLATNARP
jgi:hypothetical protein